MLEAFVYPALFGLAVWWASTVLIIYLDNLPRPTFKYTLAGTTVLFVASIAGLAATKDDASLGGVYLAFTCGILAWAWQEVSFYTGYVTGPRRQPCPEGCRGWRHFGHAVQTSLYHELAILASGVLVWWITRDGANQVGKWTFMILWWMHQSAKLNVFFGVRNLNEEFLPEHLRYLRSFFTKKNMNLFFPLSITVSTVITGFLVAEAAAQSGDVAAAAGLSFLTTLMALAILEHWLLVLPLDTAALWASGLKARRGAIEPADVTVIAGFLGAGKTTFLRRVLNEKTDQRTVVLINDFGAANVDSSLLVNRGAEVVELPNGCICCSLRGDLATQLRDTVRKYRPQRVLIEPSGVAEVATLLGVLKRPDVADLVHRLTVLTLIDASAFLRDYAHMPDYFEAQAAVSPVLIINKQDLVDAPTLRLIEYTLQPLAPEARVLHARFGAVDREALADALRAPAGVGTARVSRTSSAAQQEGGARTFTLAPVLREARAMQPASAARASQHDDHPSVEPGTAPAAALGTIARHASHDAHAGHAEHAHAHGHDHGHEHERGHGKAHGGAHTHHGVELGYVTWNGAFDGQAGSIAALEALLQQARNGAYGTLRRAKGIVNVGDGWVRFDLAGARVHIAAHVPAPMERSRATAIGESIDTAALDRAFDALMKATAERSGPLVVGAPLLAT